MQLGSATAHPAQPTACHVWFCKKRNLIVGGVFDIIDSYFSSASITQVTWKTDWDTSDSGVVVFLESTYVV